MPVVELHIPGLDEFNAAVKSLVSAAERMERAAEKIEDASKQMTFFLDVARERRLT